MYSPGQERRISPVIFRVYQWPESDSYTMENTEEHDYSSQKQFHGKFVITSVHNQKYFTAIGEMRGNPRTLGHGKVFRFFKERIREDEEMQQEYLDSISHPDAAGYVLISPQNSTILFHGYSEGYDILFTRDDVLPAAKYVAKRNKQIKTAVIFSPEDPHIVAAWDKIPQSGPSACILSNVDKAPQFSPIFDERVKIYLQAGEMMKELFVDLENVG